MRAIISCVLLLAAHVALAQYSTASCTGSCSPSQCVMTTNNCAAGTGPGFSTSTVASALTGVACRACTQSSQAKCTSANLASTWGQTGSSVVAAYCNDQFTVLWSTGIPNSWSTSAVLAGIPFPPKSDAECHLRTSYPQYQVYKIPIAPASLNAAGAQLTGNVIPNILPAAAGQQQPQFPASGPVGVAVNGVPMFPNYNNRGMFTWVSCEVDICNSHSGKGYDYHYHGDPYNCLYNISSVTNNHPNLIGYAMDGYPSYGRYTSASQDNVNLALDSCGGHSHGSFGYHYHSQVTTATTTTLDGVSPNPASAVTYNAYQLGPSQCWAGKIAEIPKFASSQQVYYDRSKSTSNSIFCDDDFTYLQPCCGSTEKYVQPGSGAVVQTTSGTGSSTCSSQPTPGGGASGGAKTGAAQWVTPSIGLFSLAALLLI